MFASLEQPVKMRRKVILKPQGHKGSHSQIKTGEEGGIKIILKRNQLAVTSSTPYLASDFNIQSVIQLLL